eukprot:COSAG04_NODE_23544_length_336_cov_1.088608_1_plen_45_part_10
MNDYRISSLIGVLYTALRFSRCSALVRGSIPQDIVHVRIELVSSH